MYVLEAAHFPVFDPLCICFIQLLHGSHQVFLGFQRVFV